ncbi:MAG TPA: hypothetical protein PLZ56_15095 [Anaerolineae bacterium]|nr:hypothetical protein [Anaerolineae bacterium]
MLVGVWVFVGVGVGVLVGTQVGALSVGKREPWRLPAVGNGVRGTGTVLVAPGITVDAGDS